MAADQRPGCAGGRFRGADDEQIEVANGMMASG